MANIYYSIVILYIYLIAIKIRPIALPEIFRHDTEPHSILRDRQTDSVELSTRMYKIFYAEEIHSGFCFFHIMSFPIGFRFLSVIFISTKKKMCLTMVFLFTGKILEFLTKP